MAITPAKILYEEHESILKVVEACKLIADILSSGNTVSVDLLQEIIDFMREFADKCHHCKEEDILFPAMENAGVPHHGCPLEALRKEHVMGREKISALQEAVIQYQSNTMHSESLIQALHAIYDLYTNHIWKEDTMVFPMESQLFSKEFLDTLVNQFENVDEYFGMDTYGHYKLFANEVINKLQPQDRPKKGKPLKC